MGAVGLLAAALLAGCTNTPPPPVVSTPVAQESTPAGKAPSQIVIGVDDVVGGYNPHNLADSSTVTDALSALLLPSVFRPDENGTPELDENLMESAEVISGSAQVSSDMPFVVAYDIRPDASWSDGAPIAAEDFAYLANAMKEEPGVVDPAGYRLISDIQSREGGKRVEVTFAKPYPGWKSLFSGLLPQHLFKDAPGGWRGALDGGFPAYGGPFSIKTLDRDRGEIILERNERWWEKPAAVDRLVLRRADQAGAAAALRSGTVQFSLSRTDSTGLKLLGELGESVQLHTVAKPRLASVLLRPSGPELKDDRVRAAIAALLDRNKLIDEGTKGGPSAQLRADSLLKPPSTAGYRPTIPAGGPPATPDPAEAGELLANAGYTRDSGIWRDSSGRQLSLVVASPGLREPYATIAKELTAQLVAAGVDVRTVSPQPRELFSNLLAQPAADGDGTPIPPADGAVGVDIAVVPQAVSTDPVRTLASEFGCAPTEPGTTTTVPAVPSNPAAFCDESLRSEIESALTGIGDQSAVVETIEPQLWQRNVVIPLFQLADTLAVSKGVSGVTPGPPLTGPFGNAVNWTRGTS
ncbi:peptide ABC transporter substrate-binding protein [Amycolatopsis albispora]|uniref:Peptide ABC transporter substrate-binding protein n=1 Tax=Amycolatopsis albispora TaxID=1804986 RepID=A0A344LL15_9PSEU|nr:peptide ABC transporter substrate-binding protein [Amycolatopsis albispora]